MKIHMTRNEKKNKQPQKKNMEKNIPLNLMQKLFVVKFYNIKVKPQICIIFYFKH